MRLIFNILLLIFIFFLTSCTQNLSGGSSDHGNANTVISIIDNNGDTVKNGSINIVSSNYTPYNENLDEYSNTITFKSSSFIKIENLPLDSYSIITFSEDSLYSAISQVNIFKNNDSFTIVLSESGTMTIPLDSNLLNPDFHYYIEELKMELDSFVNGYWINDLKVPKGKYSIKKIDGNQLYDSTLFEDITVESGYLTNISFYPKKPQGPDTVSVGDSARYYSYFDYEEHTPWIHAEFIEYQFDWGDGNLSNWQHNMYATHDWNNPGTYRIRVHIRYKDSAGTISPETFISYWSPNCAVVIVTEKD